MRRPCRSRNREDGVGPGAPSLEEKQAFDIETGSAPHDRLHGWFRIVAIAAGLG